LSAELTSANFTKANLSKVDFTSAKLREAIFTNAILNGAIFKAVQGQESARDLKNNKTRSTAKFD